MPRKANFHDLMQYLHAERPEDKASSNLMALQAFDVTKVIDALGSGFDWSELFADTDDTKRLCAGIKNGFDPRALKGSAAHAILLATLRDRITDFTNPPFGIDGEILKLMGAPSPRARGGTPTAASTPSAGGAGDNTKKTLFINVVPVVSVRDESTHWPLSLKIGIALAVLAILYSQRETLLEMSGVLLGLMRSASDSIGLSRSASSVYETATPYLADMRDCGKVWFGKSIPEAYRAGWSQVLKQAFVKAVLDPAGHCAPRVQIVSSIEERVQIDFLAIGWQPDGCLRVIINPQFINPKATEALFTYLCSSLAEHLKANMHSAAEVATSPR